MYNTAGGEGIVQLNRRIDEGAGLPRYNIVHVQCLNFAAPGRNVGGGGGGGGRLVASIQQAGGLEII